MSNIKINDVPQRIQYLGTGGQTQFTVPFPFFQNNFVYVWLNGVQMFQGGAPGQYTVSGAGSPSGGLVTFNTPVILNDIITIEGIMPIDRTSIYSATISNLTGSDLNGDFNREVVMLQQLHTTQAYLQLQYAPWALVSQDLTVTKDRYIPILEAQQVWRMNEAGDAIEPFTIDTTPAPSSSPYIIYEDDPTLEEAQNLGALTSGILKQTVTAGVATLEIAIPGVDYLDPGIALGTMAFQNANNVAITGGTAQFAGGTVAAVPISATDLVNKAYADAVGSGLTFKAACYAATTANLSTTYNNGASGVGATLTASGNGVFTVDGLSPSVAQRILVKDMSNTAYNGIYVVTDAGSVGTPYILTRASDFDSNTEIVPGSIIFVTNGTVNAQRSWVETNGVLTVGTDPIVFVTFTQTFPLSMANGGTGAVITPVANSLVYSGASTMALLAPQNSMVLTSSVAGVPTWATTLPANLVIPTPRIAQINDVNGNAMFTMNPNPTAVNNWAINNTAAGAGLVQMAPIGADTNISRDERTKGTGQFLKYSAHATVPFQWNTGTGYQHQTNWAVPNTAAARTVTLQDASGTMAYLTDQGWTLVSTATASGVASVEFTNLATYNNYCIVYQNVSPVTNAVNLAFQASINNGSSYLTGASDNIYQSVTWTNTATSASGGTLGYIPLAAPVTNLAGGGAFGVLFVGNVLSATAKKSVNSSASYYTAASPNSAYMQIGQFNTTSVVNAMRFAFTSGNVATGTFFLYGMK